MPELPEVEKTCRRLRGEVLEARIVGARFLHPATTRPQQAKVIEKHTVGHTIETIRRLGKNILVDLSGGSLLHIHLRMAGRLLVVPQSKEYSAATRAVFDLEDGRAIIFEDRRALGKIWHGEARVGKTGLEPLSAEFTREAFEERAATSRQPSKLFLMDQRHVAGLGNLYVAEILFRAGVNPKTTMKSLSKNKRALIHQSILEVMTEAVKATSPIKRAVYGREGESCEHCGTKIKRIPQGGRSTYFCPGCQR